MIMEYRGGKEMIRKVNLEKLDGTNLEKGKKITDEGKYGILILSGGQGSRLGHPGPKGTYMLDLGDTKKSIFQIHIENIMKYRNDINIFIMTSSDNNDETVLYFQENNYFGYNPKLIHFFEQSDRPLLDYARKPIIKNGRILKASAGHGDLYSAIMKVEKVIEELGVEYLLVTNVDNILSQLIDYDFIGSCINNEITAKTVEKLDPSEKVGVYAKRDGKLAVVEYTEISEELASRRDEEGLYLKCSNIMNQILSWKFIKKSSNSEIPYHEQFKEKDGIKFIKQEKLLFDTFHLANNYKIILVDRADEFAPIKSAEGKDSPDTATLMYLRYLRREEAKNKNKMNAEDYNI